MSPLHDLRFAVRLIIRERWFTTVAVAALALGIGVGDDHKGADRVVILGHGIWKNQYGADPGVLGRVLRVNGEPATSSASCQRA